MTIRALSLPAACAVVALLMPAPVSTQSASAPAAQGAPAASSGAAWKMPRTAEGKPNFEGDYMNNTFTHFERAPTPLSGPS